MWDTRSSGETYMYVLPFGEKDIRTIHSNGSALVLVWDCYVTNFVYISVSYYHKESKKSRFFVPHCENGPAIINSSQFKVEYIWMYRGLLCDFKQWCKLTEKTEEESTLLKLRYAPQ